MSREYNKQFGFFWKKELNKVFKTNMTDMVNSFMEVARAIFSRLRNAEAEYNDSVYTMILRSLNGDDTNVPVNLCRDKEKVALATSHDMHLQVNIENLQNLLRTIRATQ